jgi:cytochrome bd-type quinol oxidase subunit 2
MRLFKKYFLTSVTAIFMLTMFFSLGASATPVCDGFEENDPYGVSCGAATDLSQQDPRTIAARIINVALGLLGALATILILYAGFKWMTAAGNEEEAKKARQILTYAVIGLAIILAAYAISSFVLTEFYKATTGDVRYP